MQSDLTETEAEQTDPVAVGGGYCYLVTVENRLGEKGTPDTIENITRRP